MNNSHSKRLDAKLPYALNILLIFSFYLKERSYCLLIFSLIFIMILIYLLVKKKIKTTKSIKVFAIIALFSFWIIFFSYENIKAEPFYLLKKNNITTIKGVLRKDITYTKSGKIFALVRLKEVSDEKMGVSSSSDGCISVIVSKANQEGLKGELCEFKITSIKDNLYMASSMKILKRRNFLNRVRSAFLKDAKEKLMHIEYSKNSEVSWYARRLASLLLFQDSFDEELPIKTKGSTLGLAHIFALSGMHLNLISIFLEFILAFILPKRKIKFALLPVLGIYTFLVGASPSITRAFFMKLFSSLFSYSAKYSLFFSLLIQSILLKESILTVSFAFSFISTASLVVALSFFRFILSSTFPISIARNLSSGVCALVFSSPLSITLFGYWSLGGMFLTSISTFLISLNMIGGLFLLVYKSSIVGCLLVDCSYFVFDKILDVALYLFKEHSIKGFAVFLVVLLLFSLFKLVIYRKIRKKVLQY